MQVVTYRDKRGRFVDLKVAKRKGIRVKRFVHYIKTLKSRKSIHGYRVTRAKTPESKWIRYDFRKRKKWVDLDEAAQRMVKKLPRRAGLINIEISAGILWITKAGKDRRRRIKFIYPCNSYSTRKRVRKCLHNALFYGMQAMGMKAFPQMNITKTIRHGIGALTIYDYKVEARLYTLTDFSWRLVKIETQDKQPRKYTTRRKRRL